MDNMKKIILLLVSLCFFKVSFGQLPNACNPNPLNGTKTLQPGQSQKLITYKIKHTFTLYPSFNFTPKIYLVSFNHAWVNEPFPFCKNYKVKPVGQPASFKPYAKDTIIEGIPYNNLAKVDTTMTWIENTGHNRMDSAFSNSCVSRAKATTCITVDTVKNNSVTGIIQAFGFSQAINPPVNSNTYAFSWSGVSVEDGQPLLQGDLDWLPVIEMGKTGKSRNIRQKAGSNDPVTFNVHDFNTNLDTSGTLLSITMRHQMEDDTLSVYNYWENDTVHIESDSLLFKVEFPSPFTASQGFIYLLVQNGFIQQALKTGVFNPVLLPSPGTPVPFSFPFNNLISFHYNLDTTGLFGNDSVRVRLFMDGNNENPEVKTYDTNQVVPDINRPSCPGGNDGSITLFINYGQPPYSYSWSTGATTKDISGLSAGTYFVSVIDSLGTLASLNMVVNDPPILVLTGTKTDVTCYGAKNGSISLVATGGTPGYSFLWNDGSTKVSRNSLAPNTYTITVTDAMGCTASISFTISQPPALTAGTTQKNIKCNGTCNGWAKITGYGGTPPYTFIWNNGATTPKIELLCAGTYVATVTDNAGCTKSKIFVITQPPILSLAVMQSGPAEATALATGGTPPYVFKWFTLPVQTTATATGLIGGNVYKVKVTDALLCTATLFFTMPISREGIFSNSADEIYLSPNPFRDVLYLNIGQSSAEGCRIEVMDVLGKSVLSFNSTKRNESVNMTRFRDGLYVIKFDFGNKILMKKILKNSKH